MKTDLTGNYKEIKKLVIEQNLSLEGNSLLCEAISNNFEILQFIDYWLGKGQSIDGSNELTNKLKQFCLKDSNKLVGDEQKNWYQLLSELETYYFLSSNLGLNVIGYEQPRTNISKLPDFKIKLGNESIYFEVKFKMSEITQRLPPEFDEFLYTIEKECGNKYRITLMEVTNSEGSKNRPNYQEIFSKYLLLPENLNLIEKKIKERLNILDRDNILERKDRDSSTCNVSSINAGTEASDIQFSITLKQANSGERLYGFRPDEIDDIKRWLFEEKDDKTPMVKEAESKGADYLVCFIPFWHNLHNVDETFADYIKPLFSEMQLIDTTHAVSKDRNMGQLSGIIFLSQIGSLSNNYVFVTNARITGQEDNNLLTHKHHTAIFYP